MINEPMNTVDRFQGCLLGLACGDAVGTTVEFHRRGTFEPVTDMVGGGPFNLPVGAWTDDTSMALCLAASLVETGRFDPRDQVIRYCRWWNEGYFSSTGTCFDVGTTVASALRRFQQSGEPLSGSTDSRSAGNGCIMRLAPVPMFFWPDKASAMNYSAESSRTTHGAQECVDACRLFGFILFKALSGEDKESVLFLNQEVGQVASKIQAIANGEYREKSESEVHGTGYVVQSLEAALWCFFSTNGFEEAILKAVNLGDDADTTGAICGQIAGAFYGRSAIPKHWKDALAMSETICELANQLRLARP